MDVLPSEQIRQRIRRESLASTDYAGCGIERDVFFAKNNVIYLRMAYLWKLYIKIFRFY